MRGSYALILELKQNTDINVGKIGNMFLKKGYYVYVGSGFNGLEQRINRHKNKDKKITHWHIDYLLNYGDIFKIFIKESREKQECIIADAFSKKLSLIPDFGCSDCYCKSHLFYGDIKDIYQVINELIMVNYNF